MASNGTSKVCLLGSIALLAIACGDNRGLHSGVSSKKVLKDLSSKDIKKICDAANDFISAALPPDLIAKAGCAQQGLQTGTFEACQITTQACLESLMGD